MVTYNGYFRPTFNRPFTYIGVLNIGGRFVTIFNNLVSRNAQMMHSSLLTDVNDGVRSRRTALQYPKRKAYYQQIHLRFPLKPLIHTILRCPLIPNEWEKYVKGDQNTLVTKKKSAAALRKIASVRNTVRKYRGNRKEKGRETVACWRVTVASGSGALSPQVSLLRGARGVWDTSQTPNYGGGTPPRARARVRERKQARARVRRDGIRREAGGEESGRARKVYAVTDADVSLKGLHTLCFLCLTYSDFHSCKGNQTGERKTKRRAVVVQSVVARTPKR